MRCALPNASALRSTAGRWPSTLPFKSPITVSVGGVCLTRYRQRRNLMEFMQFEPVCRIWRRMRRWRLIRVCRTLSELFVRPSLSCKYVRSMFTAPSMSGRMCFFACWPAMCNGRYDRSWRHCFLKMTIGMQLKQPVNRRWPRRKCRNGPGKGWYPTHQR